MKISMLALALVFLSLQAVAQSAQERGVPHITNFPAKLYKAHPQVWSIEQDRQGLMYFATTTGILEYDGVNWKLIPPARKDAIMVRKLMKDKYGVVHYGGGGEIGYLDTDAKGNTRAVSLIGLIPEAYRNFKMVWSMQFTDEAFYIQSREYIFRLETDSTRGAKSFRVWKPETAFMYSFYLDGTYYVHQQSKGLYKMVAEELELIPGSEFLGEERMQVMLPYGAGPGGDKQYLLSTFSGKMVIYKGGKFYPFASETASLFNSEAPVYQGIQLKDGNYAISVIGKGLLIMDKNGQFLHQLGSDSGLLTDATYSSYQDKSGMLWIGSDAGVARIDIASPITYFNKQKGLAGTVYSVERAGGVLYAGTSTGLYSWNKARQTFEKVPNQKGLQVFNMEKDGEDLLVTTDGLFAIRNGKIITVKQSEGGNFSTHDVLIPKQHPNLLFCGGSYGIGVFSRKSSLELKADQSHWQFEGLLPHVAITIFSLMEDSRGQVWAAGIEEEIYKINPGKVAADLPDLQQTIIERMGPEQGLPIHYATIPIQNKPYFVTIDGIYTFQDQKNTFKEDSIFTRGKKFNPDNSGIFVDAYGRVFIWIDNKLEVAVPSPAGGYTFHDDLYNSLSEENLHDSFMDPDSISWYGAAEGLIRFDERLNKHRDRQPYAVLLRQVLSGKDTLSHLVQQAGALPPSRPYESNSFRFSYAALFFEKSEKTAYQTLLEGFDQEWSEWSVNTFKEYTNLPAGDYHFRVRARNIYNTLSEEAVYGFTILPPWYASRWAYGAYFLAFCGLLFIVDKAQRKRLHGKERKRAREQELAHAKEIEKAYHQLEEAHEHLKATQAQLIQQEKLASLGQLTAGIAHEIKNPLNFINNFSELNVELLEEVSTELQKLEKNETREEVEQLLQDVKTNLQKIHQHGSRADNIVKSMLLHSRGGSGKIEPTDLNALIREYVNLAFHGMRAGKSPINVRIDQELDEKVGMVPLMGEDFSRVILNLCNNAFDAMREKAQKFNGHGDYTPQLTVRTTRKNGSVFVEVEDNGPGIPEEYKDKILQPFFTTKKGTEGTGLGLSITHDIVKAHGGEILINSAAGFGTIFNIQLTAHS